MMYTAIVKELNDNIEEEAIISINNIDFTTFIAFTPYKIKIGEEYPVDITLFGDILNITESLDKKIEINRMGETFGYIITWIFVWKWKLDNRIYYRR